MLADTNVVSELARRRPDANVIAFLRRTGPFSLSVVTVEEIAFGVARAPRGKRDKLAVWFERLLAETALLEITPQIARAAGELRAARTRAGRPVTPADMLIAATAFVNGLTLLTRNTADFEGCGVTLVDPFEPWLRRSPG